MSGGLSGLTRDNPQRARLVCYMEGYSSALIAGKEIEKLDPEHGAGFYDPAEWTETGHRRSPDFVAACVLDFAIQRVIQTKGEVCPLTYARNYLADARRRLRHPTKAPFYVGSLGQQLDFKACEALKVAVKDIGEWHRIRNKG